MIISDKRNIRIEAKEWNGKWKIHIRQWYEKDGELLPGKGIALNVDEWDELVDKFKLIEEEINSHIRS